MNEKSTSLLFNAFVGTRRITALINESAKETLISQRIKQKIRPTLIKHLTLATSHFKVIGRSTLDLKISIDIPYEGICLTDLCISGFSVANLKYDVILGQDFIKKYHIKVSDRHFPFSCRRKISAILDYNDLCVTFSASHHETTRIFKGNKNSIKGRAPSKPNRHKRKIIQRDLLPTNNSFATRDVTAFQNLCSFETQTATQRSNNLAYPMATIGFSCNATFRKLLTVANYEFYSKVSTPDVHDFWRQNPSIAVDSQIISFDESISSMMMSLLLNCFPKISLWEENDNLSNIIFISSSKEGKQKN